MIVLGISTGHDSGAAVIIDGRIISAINEERLNRKKMFWGFPELSIPEVLRLAGIEPKDVEQVAIAGSSATNARPLDVGYKDVGFFRTFVAELSRTPVTGLLMGTKLGTDATRKIFSTSVFRGTSDIEKRLAAIDIHAPIDFVDHHLCHSASAYYTSGWDACLSITLDGSGDGYCSRIYDCKNGDMKLMNSVPAYHSPGFYYCYVTHLLGFTALRHEGKVTGLAAFGNPEKTRPIFAKRLSYDSSKFSFVNHGGWLQPEMRVLENLLKPFSKEDIAAGIQKHCEDVVCQYVLDAVKKTNPEYIVLSGGVFSNVKLNQEIWKASRVKDVYIFPNMGDGGLAVGAAFEVLRRKKIPIKPYRVHDMYFGSGYTNHEIEQAIIQSGFPYQRFDNVEQRIAELLRDKKIVARFNGKMEYGPRALGNRSILYHCGDRSVNTWLNEQLHRTEFMPFAPVILKEDAHEYLKNFDPDHSFASEFMTITYDVTDKCRETAPAITHVDNTARPQIITEDINPSYYRILKAYKALTGHSVMVNTSFNMHEEPIIRTPAEAIRSYEHSKIHALAMGPYVIEMNWEPR